LAATRIAENIRELESWMVRKAKIGQ